MTFAFRMDSWTVTPSNTVIFAFTYGPAPLPAEPSGAAIQLASAQDALDIKNSLLATSQERLFNLMLAISATNPQAVVGKTLTLDPTNPAALVTYG